MEEDPKVRELGDEGLLPKDPDDLSDTQPSEVENTEEEQSKEISNPDVPKLDLDLTVKTDDEPEIEPSKKRASFYSRK